MGTTRRSRGFKGFKYIWKGKFSYLNDDFDAKLMNLQEKAPCAMCSVQGAPTTPGFAEFLHTLNTIVARMRE